MTIHPKVLGAGIGAAVGGSGGSAVGSAVGDIFVWWLSLRGIVVPPNVTTAFEVLFGGIVAGLTALVTGYFTPEGKPAQP